MSRVWLSDCLICWRCTDDGTSAGIKYETSGGERIEDWNSEEKKTTYAVVDQQRAVRRAAGGGIWCLSLVRCIPASARAYFLGLGTDASGPVAST